MMLGENFCRTREITLVLLVGILMQGLSMGALARDSSPASSASALTHLPGIARDYVVLTSTAVGRDFHIYVSLPQSYNSDSGRDYSRDFSALRIDARDWFAAMAEAQRLPWRLKTASIEGGKDASHSPGSYRSGISWLFGIEEH